MYECNIVVAILIVMSFLNESVGELDALMGPFRLFKFEAFQAMNESVFTPENFHLLQKHNKLQPYLRGKKLPCRLNNTRSRERPKSVHELRPGDIDVIGGIGDSLTAGVGLLAMNGMQVALEHRGYALSAGGEGTWRSFLTLPNILKTFNRKLKGYSTATSMTIHKDSNFNLGETGAISEDMPFMARQLIRRIKAHPQVNFNDDWKMVTFMIGPNDFCSQICYKNNHTEILTQHKKEMIDVLTTLRDNLPRTIVNLIPAPNLRLLTEFSGKTAQCELSHLLECPCLFGLTNAPKRSAFFDLMEQWQRIELEIAEMSDFDAETFTVVVQPFTMAIQIPRNGDGDTDFSYLSADCFHFSQKGNALAANSLWNNILEPVGKKSRDSVEVIGDVRCPTKETPYIFTRRNSGL